MKIANVIALLGLLLIVLNVAGGLLSRTFGIYSVINIANITAGFHHLILIRMGEDVSPEAFLGRLLVALTAGGVAFVLFRRPSDNEEREISR